MIFNSLTFILFFGIVLALHNLPFSWHQKKINLLIASYLFYAAWNPPFVALLWISTVVDWCAAQWMVRAKRERTRKLWMLTSVVVNLGMLGYFKYGGLLMQNFVEIAGSIGIIYHPHRQGRHKHSHRVTHVAAAAARRAVARVESGRR